MTDERPPVAGVDDVDMPTRRERHLLGRTRPTRRSEIATGLLAIMVYMLVLIFQPEIQQMVPISTLTYWLLVVVLACATLDVALRSWRGRPLHLFTLMIIAVAGGVVAAAVAIAALPI